MGQHSDEALLALMRKSLYTPVVGDILDQLGRTHQFLPPAIRPLRPEMKLAGRAMPALVTDVYGPQAAIDAGLSATEAFARFGVL